MTTLAGVLLDLVLPIECGGCGAPSTRWCADCATALAVAAGEPILVTPRIDPGVPVFSLGRYAGPRRRAILALKEHGRADLVRPLGVALTTALQNLVAWGIVPLPITLVPGPTRASAARRRGGDPVTRVARQVATPGADVRRLLAMRAFTRDSVGLSAAARQANIAGRVRTTGAVAGARRRKVVFVDDVVTTGATATESVRVLQTAGADVVAVVTVAHA